jgi:hypothetical protein
MIQDLLKLLDLTKLSLKWWAAFSFVGIALLFIPIKYASLFGFADIPTNVRLYIGIATLFSAALLLINLIIYFWNRYNNHKKLALRAKFLKNKREKALSYLDRLSINEAAILAAFYYQNCNTITLAATDPYAKSLVTHGLIYQHLGHGLLTDWPFTINDFVWEHIPNAIQKFSEEELKHAFHTSDW